jgi:hypothetical protein
MVDEGAMKDVSHVGCNEQLLRRIRGEFLEMPGLQLTCRQAQRLFGLDERACLTLLDTLVAHEFLVHRPDGTYRRRSDGSVRTSRPSGTPLELKRTA